MSYNWGMKFNRTYPKDVIFEYLVLDPEVIKVLGLSASSEDYLLKCNSRLLVVSKQMFECMFSDVPLVSGDLYLRKIEDLRGFLLGLNLEFEGHKNPTTNKWYRVIRNLIVRILSHESFSR